MDDVALTLDETVAENKTICSTFENQSKSNKLIDVPLGSCTSEQIIGNGIKNETKHIIDFSEETSKNEYLLSNGSTSEPELYPDKINNYIDDETSLSDQIKSLNLRVETKPENCDIDDSESHKIELIKEKTDDDGHNEVNVKKQIEELQLIVAKQKVELERSIDHIKHLEQVTVQQGLVRAELEARFQILAKQYESATKEKEATVMRYAVSEKNVIDQKNAKEHAEKQLKDAIRENELLAHKLSSMSNEKSRICQILDNKCYEFNMSQKEVEKLRYDLSSCESKLKWTHNNLRAEMEAHKDSATQVEILNGRLQEASAQVEQAKRDSQEAIKLFKESQENRAYVLDQQLKEQAANLILVRHERDDREQHCRQLQSEFDKLQAKHQVIIQENNSLSLKVQQLEKERLETEKKLSELRENSDRQQQNATDLQSTRTQLEQLKLQLANEQEKQTASQVQIDQFKQRNQELQTDTEACRVRESEMLHFTQMLTEKNVRLQSEFTALETKVQQLTCEQTSLKRSNKELKTRLGVIVEQLEEEKTARAEENKLLTRHIAERTQATEQLTQQLEFQKGENLVIKRKYETSLKEMTKELQQCHKRLEQYESAESHSHSRSHSSSSSSLNTAGLAVCTPSPVNSSAPEPDDRVNQPPILDPGLDKQTLLEHIVKLQRASARKSEKLDFLEEHVRTLVAELQRKSKLLQHYMMREQTGALSSDSMDQNKAEVAKSKGVMASMYGSRITDDSLTLELSLDINRKLQAVLEDTLLKNITLKESVDTLGAEIDRLMQQTNNVTVI